MSLFFSSSHCTVYEVLVQVQSLRCMGGSLVLSERCKTERLYVYRYTGKKYLYYGVFDGFNRMALSLNRKTLKMCNCAELLGYTTTGYLECSAYISATLPRATYVTGELLQEQW